MIRHHLATHSAEILFWMTQSQVGFNYVLIEDSASGASGFLVIVAVLTILHSSLSLIHSILCFRI